MAAVYAVPNGAPQVQCKLRQWIQKTLDSKITQVFTSDRPFSLMLIKKREDLLHICVDYRRMNNITKKVPFSLSPIDQTIDPMVLPLFH